MGLCVCNGAGIMCSFGTAPGTLVILPQRKAMTTMPAATIMDNIPMTNILPFAMCTSLSNPVVAAATTAALGVLTPQPCVPATASPWAPGSSTVQIGGVPALDNMSKCMCNWGGVIQVLSPGQTKTVIGK